MVDIPDTVTITDDGKQRELFMSFGLLNELANRIGDFTNVSAITLDPKLRQDVLNLVLASRNENGVITEPVNFHTLKVTVRHVHDVMTWVSEHVLDFFLTAIELNLATHTKHQDRLIGSTASGSGSPG